MLCMCQKIKGALHVSKLRMWFPWSDTEPENCSRCVGQNLAWQQPLPSVYELLLSHFGQSAKWKQGVVFIHQVIYQSACLLAQSKVCSTDTAWSLKWLHLDHVLFRIYITVHINPVSCCSFCSPQVRGCVCAGGGHRPEQRQILFPAHAHTRISGQFLCPNNCCSGRAREECLYYINNLFTHI